MPMSDDHSHDHEAHGGHDGDAGGRGPSTSAVAIPLVALGLLGAAIWLGSQRGAAPVPQAGVPGVVATIADPLPSWNDGPAKRAILDFVTAVTDESAATFVPVAERVAVFDHDGTLVCEKPVIHGLFLVDRVKALVERRPELAHEEPYATIMTGDVDFIRKLGKKFFAELTFATLAGVPEEQLEREAREFVRTARHPVFDTALGDVTFQPMKELVSLLRSKGFSVWICSGSGVHFMRPMAEAWYGIGPEHVIASRPVTEMREVEPATPENGKTPNRRLDLVVLPQVQVFNDEERKPVSIGEHVGRRPIFAAGNVGTTGDIEMLRWSQSGDRPSLQLLVLHDDAEREMAYGEPGGESLDAAAAYGWQVVRMAKDWKRVFAKPLERKAPQPSIAPPPAPTATPAATTPPKTAWAMELAAIERADREASPTPGGVVLLGSSNIRLWTTLADDFAGMNVVNRGVEGCLLTELAEQASRLVAAAKPRVIVVAAGTNDVAAGTPPETIRAAFERLVAGLRADHPDAAIVFLAISPTIKRWDQRERQAEANAAIKELIDAAPAAAKLVYLDANAAFLGPDGTPAKECFADDQQHPSTIGNARRAEIMRPVLRDLLGTP
jgi:lysophospholipase L1-like esterase/phosphoserine phosphatase